jgi:hypothetical protein
LPFWGRGRGLFGALVGLGAFPGLAAGDILARQLLVLGLQRQEPVDGSGDFFCGGLARLALPHGLALRRDAREQFLCCPAHPQKAQVNNHLKRKRERERERERWDEREVERERWDERERSRCSLSLLFPCAPFPHPHAVALL